ncbi:Uncharacterised protein [Bordetella pertussis]|nr:Uncharacterised protein [Bordetella pertussis]
MATARKASKRSRASPAWRCACASVSADSFNRPSCRSIIDETMFSRARNSMT